MLEALNSQWNDEVKRIPALNDTFSATRLNQKSRIIQFCRKSIYSLLSIPRATKTSHSGARLSSGWLLPGTLAG